MRAVAEAMGVTPNDLLTFGPLPDKRARAAALLGEDPDEASLIRNRPGYAALITDPEACRRIGVTEAALEGIGRVPFPVELLPLRTKRAMELTLRFLEAINAADEE